MNWKTPVVLAFIVCLTLTQSVLTQESVNNFTVSGNKVYVDDDNAYISATPHTVKSSGWIEIEVVSKQYAGNIDVAFGFDSEIARPKDPQLYDPYFYNVTESYTCNPPHWFNYTTNPKYAWCWNTYPVGNDTNETATDLIFGHSFTSADLPSGTIYWQEQRFNEWTSISGLFTKVSYDYDGKDTWYYVRNMPVEAGQTYRLKFWLDVNINTSGKYDVAIKPSSLTIAEAIQQGKFYFLDPWWNTSFSNKMPFYCQCPHCSEDTEMILLASNSTNNAGAFIDGSLELFFVNITDVNSSWRICSYLYFNDETDYVMADVTETFQIETFIDEGNSTDFGTPEKGLVAWYHLNGTDGFDSSFYGHHLTTSGDPARVAGQIGHATDYDANDFQSTVHTAHLNPNTQLTLMAWINKASFTANQGFISKRDGGDLTYIYYSPSQAPGNQRLTWENSIGTVGDLGSSVTITDGTWTHIAVTHNGTHVTFYTNGTAEAPVATAVALTNTLSPPFQLASDGAGNLLTGILDEVRVYNRSLSSDEIMMIYNNTVGTNNVTQFGDVEVLDVVTNTSIMGVNFNVSDFTFASSTYVTGLQADFNTTASNTNFTLLSAVNLEKLTGGGTNIVTVRVLVDGTIVLEEDMRTITEIGDEGAVITRPVIFNVSSGEHNITYDFRRTGTGSVSVNDVDIVLLQFETDASNSLRGTVTSAVYDHTSTSFTTAFNWTINKTINASTYITVKQTINKSGAAAATATYYIENLETGDVSPFWQRRLENDDDIGSIGGVYLDNQSLGQHNYSIQSMQSDAGETVSVNGTILDFDMIDNSSNTIQNFQVSNTSTNSTTSQNYTAGTYLLANQTVTMVDGDSYFLSMHSSFSSSSGAQLPSYKINATELSEANCTSKKERYLSDSDIGNAVIYTICNGLSVGTAYNFSLWLTVPSGETITQIDESLNGFEVTEISIVIGNTAPIVAILNPDDGDTVIENVSIDWSTVDPQGNSYTTNITLANSTDTIQIATNLVDSISSFTWNSSTVSDGDYNLTVESCENATADLFCGNDTVLIAVDNIAPALTICDVYPVLIFDGNNEIEIGFEFNCPGILEGLFLGDMIYGEMWFHNDLSNVTTTINSQDVYVNLTGFDTGEITGQTLNGFTYFTDTLVAQVAGRYKVDYSLSFGNVGNNQEYQLHVVVNGEGQNNTDSHRKVGSAGDVGNVGSSGFIDLGVGDQVNLQIRNNDGTGDVVSHVANMNLIRIGDR